MLHDESVTMQLFNMRNRLHEYVSYSDESCTTGHAFMVIGGVLCTADAENDIARRISGLMPNKPSHWSYEWKHIRRSNSDRYADFIDLFFELNRQHKLDFRCLVIDCSRLDHGAFNQGDGEKGFNKFLYQYLLSHHRELGYHARFVCHHDQRSSRYDLREVQKMLNAVAMRRDVKPQIRYRRVAYRDMKHCPLMQFADVLIGAVGYAWNEKEPGARESIKPIVADYIRKMARLHSLSQSTPRWKTNFNIWNFALSVAQGPSPR